MHKDLAGLEAPGCDLPQTRRGHERRLALLLSANALFLERGFDAVSLDDIVHHAGGSKASIYKYFGNKVGLFTAICDYRREIFLEGICVPFKPGKDQLKGYLTSTLITFSRHITDPEHIAFMRLVIEQSQKNPEVALYLHEQGPKRIQQAIASALSRTAEQGQIVCPDPMYSAMMYFGILRNFEWQIIMGLQQQFSEQEIIEYIQYCVERFLDGHRQI
ncbi:TetR/AcrR family transcriptional regulator [Acinetobacter sp. WZC-1]|uniref:TetR/AcrR family transcriptional regulator n=1 Tax=Acinetobacter sp. WZC-1 TaxID=3459034 RepID=UPI00403DC8A2